MAASLERLALSQGAFWAATGIWPLLHYRSFIKITGPKKEPWLVKTVGALVAVIGGTLVLAGIRKAVNVPVRVLAVGSAAAVTAVELVYGLGRRISPVYLGDAVLESAWVAGWLLSRPAETPVCTPLATAEDMPVGGCFDIATGETRLADGKRDDVLESSMESFPASDPPQH